MELIAVVVIAVAAMLTHVWRDRLAAAERLEAARERGELINRLTHPEVRPYVPAIAAAQPPAMVPLPPVGDDAESGWNQVGTDTSAVRLSVVD